MALLDDVERQQQPHQQQPLHLSHYSYNLKDDDDYDHSEKHSTSRSTGKRSQLLSPSSAGGGSSSHYSSGSSYCSASSEDHDNNVLINNGSCDSEDRGSSTTTSRRQQHQQQRRRRRRRKGGTPWYMRMMSYARNAVYNSISVALSPTNRYSSISPTAAAGRQTFTFHNSTRKIGKSTTTTASPLLPRIVIGRHNLVVDVQLIFIILFCWYSVGVMSICTTKLLVTPPPPQSEPSPSHDGSDEARNSRSSIISGFGVPPILLTFQQLLLGSLWIRYYLLMFGGDSGADGSPIQPISFYPSTARQQHQQQATTTPPRPSPTATISPTTAVSPNRSNATVPEFCYDLLLAGIFNGCDFLLSNFSFSHSAASFVETIKASEPITTTFIAIVFGIDTLHNKRETASLILLIVGVICATMGNGSDGGNNTNDDDDGDDDPSSSSSWSIYTCIIVMSANICFALRARSQKVLRKSDYPIHVLNDSNLLMYIQQIGALFMLLPLVILFQIPTLLSSVSLVCKEFITFCSILKHVLFLPVGSSTTSMIYLQFQQLVVWKYVVLSLFNSACFTTYSLASCYVLSKVSVVQHTGLNCVRRICAIVLTSIAFGVPITSMESFGIVLCFTGFTCFTYYRQQTNHRVPEKGS